MKVIVCLLLVYILTVWCKCVLFQFLSRRIDIYIPILAGAQNGRMPFFKKKMYFAKKMFFSKYNFQDESHLHANCLFCILILYRKWFSILTRVQNESFTSWKNCRIFLTIFFFILKLNFQDEGQLHASYLFYFLII